METPEPAKAAGSSAPSTARSAASGSAPPSARSAAAESVAQSIGDEQPKSTGKQRITTNVALHELLTLEEDKRAGYIVPVDTARDDELLDATFSTDPTVHREAALHLARVGRYSAAKNFLLLAQMHDPPSFEADKVCETAVNATRNKAARRFNGAGNTWADFASDDRDRVRIAHRLLVVKDRPAHEQDVWLKMLVRSPDFFGGETSQLTLAFVELIRAAHINHDRFVPPAKVLAYDEKSSAWLQAVLLEPDEGGNRRIGAPKAKTVLLNAKREAAKKAPEGSTPRSSAYDSEDEEEEEKASVSSFDRLFKSSTAASSIANGTNPLLRKADDGPPPMYVRFKATADLPQRTMWLKRSLIVRDVGRATPTAYLPGVMLLEAAAVGAAGFVEALLEANVSIHEVDSEATSALLHAAFNCATDGHRAVCQMLVEHGADPDSRNMNNVCAWECTLMRSDRELRRIFRPSDSDKDCTPKATATTELHRAIFAGNEELALSSLDRASGRLENGITPLMGAARMGQLKVVQQLLERGFRPEQKSTCGCTATNLAAEEGHVTVLRSLLASRCKPDLLFAPDASGMTPLMRATENRHLDTMELLLDEGRDDEANRSNHKGWTPLMLACCNGLEDGVKMLLEHNANSEAGRQVGTLKSASGAVEPKFYTALCYAASLGHAKCITALLKDDQVSLEEQRGSTALELATRYEHWECVDALRGLVVEKKKEAAPPQEAEVQTQLKNKIHRDLTRVMDMFKAADVNNDHSLSIEEFQEAVAKAGISASEAELRDFFSSMDMDHSSSIDFNELNKVLRKEAKEDNNKPAPPVREKRQVVKRVKAAAAVEEEAPAYAHAEMSVVDPNDLKAMQEELAAMQAELQKLRVDKRRTKSELTLALEAAALEAKQPWAYSPSGRWRPGLWSGAQDRNTPISRRLGEPAKSIALVDLLPLGTSSLYSA